jgi:hypothetical protein
MTLVQIEFIGGPYDGEVTILPDEIDYMEVSAEYDEDDDVIPVMIGKYLPINNHYPIWTWEPYE